MGRCSALVGVVVVLAAGILAAAAAADPDSGPVICPTTETAIDGTYHNLTITGERYVPAGDTLAVTGNLRIARGACLDAFTLGTVTVGGDVVVRKGSILALGCDPLWDAGYIAPPCNETATDDVVGGNLTAFDATTMYLSSDTIDGNVTSFGGGPGTTLSPYTDFPIKDNTIGGNVLVEGWDGSWFGFIRNTVAGNVLLTGMDEADPDSSEIVTNTISGWLACFDDTPAPQFGDSGGSQSVTGTGAFGQCTTLAP